MLCPAEGSGLSDLEALKYENLLLGVYISHSFIRFS